MCIGKIAKEIEVLPQIEDHNKHVNSATLIYNGVSIQYNELLTVVTYGSQPKHANEFNPSRSMQIPTLYNIRICAHVIYIWIGCQ